MSKGAQQLKASDQLQQIAALPGSCVLTNFSLLRPAGEVVHIERTEDRGISISTNWSNMVKPSDLTAVDIYLKRSEQSLTSAWCGSGVPQLLLLLDFVRIHIGHWCETSSRSETFTLGQQLTFDGFLAMLQCWQSNCKVSCDIM